MDSSVHYQTQRIVASFALIFIRKTPCAAATDQNIQDLFRAQTSLGSWSLGHRLDTMNSVPEINIRSAQPSDYSQLASMMAALWPNASAEEHLKELTAILGDNPPLTMPLAILVAEATVGELVGFVEVDLRSHADGCNPVRSVGYIEGWYVAEDYRKQGLGRKLVRAAEDWSRSHGCLEIASDTWIDNEVSQQAHAALGYEVVDRCVHYRKKL